MVTRSIPRSVLLLSFGTFIVGTDAHSVAGLLPEMASSLQTSVAGAGQSVTVFAIAYAVLAPIWGVVMARHGQRRTLVSGLVLFVLGNALTAVAGSMPVLLAGRVVAAAGAAMFTPAAGAMAVRLAGPERRGTALAWVTTGVAGALVLGALVGAAIASAASWRVTLAVIAVLGLAMLPGVLLLHPVPPAPAQRFADQLPVLRSPQILTTLGISVIAFVGVFIPYTYLSQSYAPLVAALPGGISTVLLLFGLTSVIGVLASGPLTDRVSPRWMVVVVTAALAVVDAAAVLGRESPLVLVAALLAAGYLSWSILTPQQHQLVAAEPDHAAVLISFNAAAGYVGISLAGVLGGTAITMLGSARFTLVASAFLLVAACWRAVPVPRADRAEPEVARRG
ncbi:MFS transporter [Saccharopolyspora sp. NPDC002686]|uniref:MFS transporter n=1 Tax=Saccharopolyspora sp. NPDC002686 TaxID=3154541 RepID=UPI00332B026F